MYHSVILALTRVAGSYHTVPLRESVLNTGLPHSVMYLTSAVEIIKLLHTLLLRHKLIVQDLLTKMI